MSTKKRILILQAHPDPAAGHYGHALAQAYGEAARVAGHKVRHIDIAQLDFPLLGSKDAFEHGVLPPALAEAQAAIGWAEHVLILFPLWLGTLPALLKAFFEQVLRPGFAFRPGPRGGMQPGLRGRSARLVVTMGMPEIVYRWYFRAHAVKNLKRNILGFVGYGPVRDTIVGGVATAKPATMTGHFETMRALGRGAR